MSFYEKISAEELEKYAEASGLSGKTQIDLDFFVNFIKKGDDVLEVGCGSGRIGRKLSGFTRYVGVDTSQEYLEYFSKRTKDAAELICDDFLEYKTKKKFNAIIFPWAVLWEWSREDQVLVIQKAKSFLKDGGYILIDTPTSDTKHNQVDGYNPTKIYFDEWLPIFKEIGFSKIDSKILKTHNSRKREITILQK
ncbi:class I SAM-dependent methyltransferase [Candidatus Wolfebacteria bacterium]|nr:class I SAM-dependent methyltransferase [Candidatus Wolfebacteria bacterium]